MDTDTDTEHPPLGAPCGHLGAGWSTALQLGSGFHGKGGTHNTPQGT